MMTDAAEPPKPTKPPRNNWGWIAYFIFIVVASVGVAGFMIWFNLSIQLTPEQLEAARALWKENGIKNYDMIYVEKHSPEDRVMTFVVRVRKGEVKEVTMNGKALEKDKDRTDDPKIYHSMDALMRFIENNQFIDSKPGAPKVYVTGVFDEKTGALRKYIRRVMGSAQRVEILVTEFAVR